MSKFKITSKLINEINKLLDKGLIGGDVGDPKPGKMCVEAAICYALGEDHGDSPSCVAPTVREFKISLNDADWTSNKARADGMRDLAIAQLGSKDIPDLNFKFADVLDKHLKLIIFPYLVQYLAQKQPKNIWVQMLARVTKPEEIISLADSLSKDTDFYLSEHLKDLLRGDLEIEFEDYFTDYTSAIDDPRYGFYRRIDEKYFGKNNYLKKVAEAGLAALKELKSPGVKWI